MCRQSFDHGPRAPSNRRGKGRSAAERRSVDVRCDLLGPGHVVSSWVMASSGLKQKMVATIEHLPENATVEDAIERLYFLAKVERGLEQSAAGDTIAHEDIKKRFPRFAGRPRPQRILLRSVTSSHGTLLGTQRSSLSE